MLLKAKYEQLRLNGGNVETRDMAFLQACELIKYKIAKIYTQTLPKLPGKGRMFRQTTSTPLRLDEGKRNLGISYRLSGLPREAKPIRANRQVVI